MLLKIILLVFSVTKMSKQIVNERDKYYVSNEKLNYVQSTILFLIIIETEMIKFNIKNVTRM